MGSKLKRSKTRKQRGHLHRRATDRPRPEGGHAIPHQAGTGGRTRTDGGQQKEQKWQLIYHIQPFLVSYSNGGPAGRRPGRQTGSRPRPRPRSRRNSVLFFAPSSEKNAGGEKKEGTKEELSLPVSHESVTTSQSVSQSVFR